jgi:nucleoredoxin
MPTKVAGRLPESVMPLKTQVLASEEQKKMAITSFFHSSSSRFAAYTTKAGSPIYILDSASYPLVKLDAHTLQATTNGNTWSTFRFLPEPLVPEDDNKARTQETGAKLPSYDVPLETNFFDATFGTQLLTNNTTRLPTSVALHNARLVGLYFSAHWCGPCRSFTPMLAEMYAHLKEHRPSHGLEIVFVSSDRDANSFSQYFGTMPWQAVPFDQIQMIKSALNMTYGIRGIPSLVVLDAVTGQVVVPANESRQAVGMACRGGEQAIETLLDSWLDRVPMETKEILSMLELSCQEDDQNQTLKDDKENPYLLSAAKSTAPLDPAARIKEFFEKLVAEGNDPTSAAAKAIGLVADEQKSGRKYSPGPLDGKAIRKGPIVRTSGLDEVVAQVIERNSIPVVRNVFNILMKYLANATSEPWSPKFRTFKLSNKVADQVVSLEGGLSLIQSLGFEIHGTSQEFKATVPVSMDLEATTRTLTGLIKELDEKF